MRYATPGDLGNVNEGVNVKDVAVQDSVFPCRVSQRGCRQRGTALKELKLKRVN